MPLLALPPPLPSVARAVRAGLHQVRAHPMLNPVALEESLQERSGYPVDPDHRPHLVAAVEWLERAQDAIGDGGIARGYSLGWNPYFRSRGWQPAYPETTGYIIPTLYEAARQLERPELARRAERAARWELEIQLASGAVRGGVIGEPTSPAVFNTGQVLLGWLAAFAETGAGIFAGGARRAASYLLATLDQDGVWRRGNSRFAHAGATLYNARTAWALAEAGRRLGAPEFRAAAAKNLRVVAQRQHDDGWFPDCCLSDPRRPLLHTIAYAIRGLIEGGRVLEDEQLIAAGARAAERVALATGPDGRLPGRFASRWRGAGSWSCLTGEVQMANVWLRLFAITGERHWLEPVEPVLRFVKSTQNRTSDDTGVRGGIKGSFPVGAEYGPYQILSWATKFLVDALLRDERRHAGVELDGTTAVLA